MTKRDLTNEFVQEHFLNRNKLSCWKFDENTICNSETPDFNPSDFVNLTWPEMQRRLGRKWIGNLLLIASLADAFKHLSHNYIKHPWLKPTKLHLATTNTMLLNMFGSKKNVSRVLLRAQRVGYLAKTSNTYRFNARHNFSKEYAVNKHAENLLLEKAHELNLSLKRQNSSDAGETIGRDGIVSDIADKFRDSIKVVSKDIRIPACISDEDICRILDQRYAILLEGVNEKISRLNSLSPVERQIKFKWNIHRSKHFITKIGIRATSPIVSLKEHANENDSYTGKWRCEYLEENGFNVDEFDVHGSVSQVSHLLSTGQPISNKIDPYKKMFGDDLTDEERSWYKAIFMKLYFDRPNSILNHLRDKVETCLRKYGKTGLQPIVNNLVDDVYKFTGKSLDSEVFLHESLIYIDLVCELLDAGYQCVQIYDGFYFNRSVPLDLMERLLEKVSLRYYDKYQRWKKALTGTKTEKDEHGTQRKTNSESCDRCSIEPRLEVSGSGDRVSRLIPI